MRGFLLHSGASASPADAHGLPSPPAWLQLHPADLDQGVDPARDLHAHVNDRWCRSNALPAGHRCWDAFSVLQERSLHEQLHVVTQLGMSQQWRGDAAQTVGALWRSANRFLAGEQALPAALQLELARIGRLDHATALRRYLIDRHARGWPLLFYFDVQPDLLQPDAHIVVLRPAGLSLPDATLYGGTDPLALRWQQALREYATTVFCLLGHSPQQAGVQAEAVLALEASLAAATPSGHGADNGPMQRRVTIAEADAGNPLFSWREFLHSQGLPATDHISLPHPAFHTCWQRLLHQVPAWVWRAYLQLHTVDSLADALHEPLAVARQRFLHGTRGEARDVPAWQRILCNIEQHAGASLGELYLQNVGRDTAPLLQLCELLRGSLRQHIASSRWLADSTRDAALAKLQALRFCIGGNSTAPLHPLLGGHDWTESLLALRSSHHRHALRRLRQPVDRDALRLTPQTPNACYDPIRNIVEIPAALLRPPFFHGSGEHAANLGGIGAVIAHEMMHAFGHQGSRFDAGGALRATWKLGDHLRFDRRSTALAQFIDRAPGVPRDYHGERHLPENTADLAGLAAAFHALPAGSSADDGRRFFHTWASCWRQLLAPAEATWRQRFDTHAPAVVRVNAASAAIPGFARLFGAAGDGFRFW